MLPIQWRALRATRSKSIQAATAALFIVATVLSLLCGNVQAQNPSTFSSTDRFDIPQLNGSIRFGYNGSYASATLANDTWVFTNLTLNNFSRPGTFKVSVRNSNITIYSFFLIFSNQSRISVRYNAQGAGQQFFDFGLDKSVPTHQSEWSVTRALITGSVFLANGQGWELLPDNTVIITGQTGNISVSRFSFGVPNDSNLPFYERHSVALITIAVVAATVAVGAIISVKVRKHKDVNGN
jgi:hypothetical protein